MNDHFTMIVPSLTPPHRNSVCYTATFLESNCLEKNILDFAVESKSVTSCSGGALIEKLIFHEKRLCRVYPILFHHWTSSQTKLLSCFARSHFPLVFYRSFFYLVPVPPCSWLLSEKLQRSKVRAQPKAKKFRVKATLTLILFLKTYRSFGLQQNENIPIFYILRNKNLSL